jgi:hypothetical protein
MCWQIVDILILIVFQTIKLIIKWIIKGKESNTNLKTIIIEENYKKLYVLYKTYRNLKQINGKLINVLRIHKEYAVFHNINENLIKRTKSEEPVLKIEQNAVIKQEKDWFLGNVIIF